MVECTALERRRVHQGTEGSNPSPSAIDLSMQYKRLPDVEAFLHWMLKVPFKVHHKVHFEGDFTYTLKYTLSLPFAISSIICR